MYEIIPDGNGQWTLRNTVRGRSVVSGISREGCLRLKKQLETNHKTRLESMGIKKHESRPECKS